MAEYGGARDLAFRASHTPRTALPAVSATPELLLGYDTWSGFLSGELQDASCSSLPVVGSAASIARTDMMTALTKVISRQNAVVESLQKKTVELRTAERSPSQLQNASDAVVPVENMPAASVLQLLLTEAQERWMKLVSEKVGGVNGTPDVAGGLPSTQNLLDCLVDGMGSAATIAQMEKLLIPHEQHGIDATGVLTVFAPHVQSIGLFPNLLPSLEMLRVHFLPLDPVVLDGGVNTTRILGSSLSQAESQLDALLRGGDSPDVVCCILRETVHPSLRRLVYPRALGIKLVVTDGQAPFAAKGEFAVNQLSESILAHLTCASRYAREKVKRRNHHTFSVPQQEANTKAIRSLLHEDVSYYVGDSDKYFVYMDDVDTLSSSLIGDRSIPEGKLLKALVQMGRPEGALDAYIAYLHWQEGDLVLRRAPPCGFFPAAASSTLIAPLCNVTGDTVEQYELMTAMFSQLWIRLQGPTPELLQCCLIFENLVCRLAMPACVHAMHVLQASPLKLALDWMLSGFTDVLDSYEVLCLWDWILAFHTQEMCQRSPLSCTTGLASPMGLSLPFRSGDPVGPPCALWLLPIFAASVFIFRAPLVLKCETKGDFEALFSAGHHLQCRPLIQSLLFTEVLAQTGDGGSVSEYTHPLTP